MEKKNTSSAHSSVKQIAKLERKRFDISGTYYILFKDHPICVVEGDLFEMQPIDDPSLGYKLVTANVNKKTALEQSMDITEKEAMDILFKSE